MDTVECGKAVFTGRMVKRGGRIGSMAEKKAIRSFLMAFENRGGLTEP